MLQVEQSSATLTRLVISVRFFRLCKDRSLMGNAIGSGLAKSVVYVRYTDLDNNFRRRTSRQAINLSKYQNLEANITNNTK